MTLQKIFRFKIFKIIIPKIFKNSKLQSPKSTISKKFSTSKNPKSHKISIKLRLFVQQLLVLTSKFVDVLKCTHDNTHEIGENQGEHQVQQAS
jgi:hypothetical protein